MGLQVYAVEVFQKLGLPKNDVPQWHNRKILHIAVTQLKV
jgi:hypothetical protein